MYMIRRKSDGLFSSGGVDPKFKKRGKVWNNRSALSNHLVLIGKRAQGLYDGCEVLVQEVDGPARVVSSVADYVTELNARRQ